MRFYTNVQMVGDNFLVRGYEDGKHFMTREKFYPTLFVSSKNKSKYKTLTGQAVEPVKPGTVRECRDFIKNYGEVENFNIFGNERFIYQYISDKYSENEVKFDIERIKLKLLPKIQSETKVSYRTRSIKCGKESCNSCPHGPYWYAEWTEGGKRKTKYLGKNLTDA